MVEWIPGPITLGWYDFFKTVFLEIPLSQE